VSTTNLASPPSLISGQRLFFALLIGLTLAAIGFDLLSAKLSWQASLTLPFALSFGLTAALGYWVVPMLRRLKTGQVVREDGPQSHLKKSGTPTMGGIFFIPPALLVALVWSTLVGGQIAPEVVAAIALTLAYGFIGWLDDWQVLRNRSNKGISAKLRLFLEIMAATLFCAWLVHSQPSITTLQFPFRLVLPLGFLFWPLAIFVPTAQSNALNLTDGLDGLAAGTGAVALMAMGVLVAPSAPGTTPGLTIFCACLSGACLGFLRHNHNPAKVFMGDTGSLALGGALAAIGLASNCLWGLLIVSGIFLTESLSVIAQVGYYKATKDPDGKGKRLFRMAPLHHHLELGGWAETRVVATFYGVTVLLGLSSWLLKQL
jgi:phospho-N-acetylmuramoyl-pentapeptide-transferase